MTLTGKGFYIWQIRNCEGGDINAIANAALQAGLSHVVIKIADGLYKYNIDWSTGYDRVPPLVNALQSKGIQAWGWHYVYGDYPRDEADLAIQRVQALHLNGYVIDAEAPYKADGKEEAAEIFMTRLRSALPSMPIALSSYRFPSYHPAFPFDAFLEKCDLNMPQVYWIGAHNPGEQLNHCVDDYQNLQYSKPIFPTGAAFIEGSWAPTDADELEFMNTAKLLGLEGVNYWEWSNCRRNLPMLWETIADYDWSAEPIPSDITQQYINALNTHDSNQVVELYYSNAVHVTPKRTIQGTDQLLDYFQGLLHQLLPEAIFTLLEYSGLGNSRNFKWTATSPAGNVNNGEDVFGLLDEKIIYHYSKFDIS